MKVRVGRPNRKRTKRITRGANAGQWRLKERKGATTKNLSPRNGIERAVQ